MPTPAVSIVICTRNRADRLGDCLSALAKVHTDLPWEAVIVDNASTDHTKAVIERSGWRYLYAGRIGLGAARDVGWREAKGDIVSFTDDDCYVDPGYVDTIAQVFREHPKVGAVGGRILLFDPTDARMAVDDRTEQVMVEPMQFIEAGALHGANLSFRRKALEDIGGFSPRLGAGTAFPAEDCVAYASVLWAGYPLLFDPRPLVHHHHGRKPAELPDHLAEYDKGRGAYYAEFIRRPQSRAAYVRNWWRIIKTWITPERMDVLKREVRSGSTYLWRERAFGAWAMFSLMGWAMIAYVEAILRRRGLKTELSYIPK